MYIPKDATTLEQITETQIRLGIQGAPKTGKTFAATTFPNCIFLNLDRGLGAHAGRKDVMEVKFWDDKYVDTIISRTKSDTTTPNPPNRRDALIKWLMKEGQLLEADQTLVIDGSTDIETGFDTQESLEPVHTKQGRVDDFAYWRHKVEYFGMLTKILKTLKCHIIYICHETPDRNKEGELNGKLRPMLTGQFGDKLASQFTDWFRQHAFGAEICLNSKLAQYTDSRYSNLSSEKTRSPANFCSPFSK